MCLPYLKRYFQEHQWSDFLFMPQITQILLFSGVPFLERSNITVWEQPLFKEKLCCGSFRYVSNLRKKVFSGAPVMCDFLMTQITQIPLFSVMSIWQRSKITVWGRHIFLKKNCYGSFRYVSTLCGKVFSGAPVKCFSLYGSNNSDSVVSPEILLLVRSKIIL